MKAYSVYWKDESMKETVSGNIIVVAESITKAIARFQKTAQPERIIESVYLEGKEVLIDGQD